MSGDPGPAVQPVPPVPRLPLVPPVPPAVTRSRRGSGRRTAGALLAGVVGAPLLLVGASWAWVHGTTAGDRYPAATVPERPVAIVFGAAVLPDHTPSQFLAGRLDTARALWAAGRVRVIVVSGDNGARNYDEPTAMRDYLVRAGVPAPAVVRDFAGFDTYATCVRAHDVFGITRAVVVSQDYHLPRALRLCRSVGIDAVGVGSRVGAGTSTWAAGSRREVLADVKAVWEAVSRPAPRFGGPPDSAVTDALAARDGG